MTVLLYNGKKTGKKRIVMKDWDASLYRKFEKQRTQPAKDLISRIELSPKSVLDLGCGPGNSTEQLNLAYKDAFILGIDSSPAMLRQAEQRLPECSFKMVDANGDLAALGFFDLVFSNAVLQWLPDHPGLIKKLFGMLNPGGALAVQIPNVLNLKIQQAIQDVLNFADYKERFAGFFPFYMHSADYYCELLSRLSSDYCVWETTYFHVMQSFGSIIEWYSSTGFRRYHAKLTEQEIPVFNDRVLKAIKKYYRELSDGSVLFPFIRLFFIVYNR